MVVPPATSPPATSPPTAPPPTTPPPAAPPPTAPPPTTPPPITPPPITPPPTAPPTAGKGWTAGRVVALVIGAMLAFASLGLLGAGGIATWAEHTQRDASGYLTSDAQTFVTSSYAITSDKIDLGPATDTFTPAGVLGTVRVRATAVSPAKGVFVGVGRRSVVDAYLAGVDHLVVTNWVTGEMRAQGEAGAAPATPPVAAGVWTAYAAGSGTQTLRWRPTGGQWVVVVMNPSGGPAVSVVADVGATVPDLGWIGVALLVAGAVLLFAGAVLIAVSVGRASR